MGWKKKEEEEEEAWADHYLYHNCDPVRHGYLFSYFYYFVQGKTFLVNLLVQSSFDFTYISVISKLYLKSKLT